MASKITLTGETVSNAVATAIKAVMEAHLAPGQYEAEVLPGSKHINDESVAFKVTGTWEGRNMNDVSAEVTINWRGL